VNAVGKSGKTTHLTARSRDTLWRSVVISPFRLQTELIPCNEMRRCETTGGKGLELYNPFSGANWSSQDYSSQSCRWCSETCFIVALPSIICSFRIRLESLTSRAFRVMQCLPIAAAWSILRWSQFSDRQKREGGRAITGTAMKRQTSL
jgi:hypothetical protein